MRIDSLHGASCPADIGKAGRDCYAYIIRQKETEKNPMPIMPFQNDYAQGAHPRILKALAGHNKSTEPSYGADRYSRAAAGLIRQRAGAQNLTVRFISSGTQTNLVAAASSLSPFEACLAAESAHIATHETGAIEATGHCIIRVPAREGKLS